MLVPAVYKKRNLHPHPILGSPLRTLPPPPSYLQDLGNAYYNSLSPGPQRSHMMAAVSLDDGRFP